MLCSSEVQFWFCYISIFPCHRLRKKIVKRRFSTFYIAKKPFWTTKTSVSKTQKIAIFPKGLVHGFDQKIGNFDNNSFYAKYTQRKVFAEVLVRKPTFLDNINMDLKRRQNWPFCNPDSPYFWSKSWSFFMFCVYQK